MDTTQPTKTSETSSTRFVRQGVSDDSSHVTEIGASVEISVNVVYGENQSADEVVKLLKDMPACLRTNAAARGLEDSDTEWVLDAMMETEPDPAEDDFSLYCNLQMVFPISMVETIGEVMDVQMLVAETMAAAGLVTQIRYMFVLGTYQVDVDR